MMMRCAKKIGLVFFVDEKNTRTNVTSWKKAFYGWVELFREFPDDLLDSVGWITTKCPSEFVEDSFSKRIRNFQNTIKTEKLVDSVLVDKMFDSVVNNNHFEIFKKTTGNEEV